MDQSSGAKRIRALDRGLQIVEFLSRHGASSLAVLRQETRLGNATLLRILETLRDRGWVRRNLVEGKYELSGFMHQIVRSTQLAKPLAEVAAPILVDLMTAQNGLPSELVIPVAFGKIEVIESTRRKGRMAPARTGIGIQPSLVFSAHGRATLAAMPPELRNQHLEAVWTRMSKTEQKWISDGTFNAELAATRKRGYALRQPNYWEKPFDFGPPLGVAAVPIFGPVGMYGSLSLIWLAEEMDVGTVERSGGLSKLRSAAADIGRSAHDVGLKVPRFYEIDGQPFSR